MTAAILRRLVEVTALIAGDKAQRSTPRLGDYHHAPEDWESVEAQRALLRWVESVARGERAA